MCRSWRAAGLAAAMVVVGLLTIGAPRAGAAEVGRERGALAQITAATLRSQIESIERAGMAADTTGIAIPQAGIPAAVTIMDGRRTCGATTGVPGRTRPLAGTLTIITGAEADCGDGFRSTTTG